jgi:putative transcriptional regulator
VTAKREPEIDLGEDLIMGLRNVLAHARGDSAGSRQHVVPVTAPDVRAARQKLRMSQAQLAEMFCVSQDTVRHWERGNRHPEGPARILLRMIEREPDAVLRALRD